MRTNDDFDLIVLGGGMAGLPVAMKCAYSGMETALVEDDLLSGTCLNRGCISTKTMIRSAKVANLARRSEVFGVEIDGDVAAVTCRAHCRSPLAEPRFRLARPKVNTFYGMRAYQAARCSRPS